MPTRSIAPFLDENAVLGHDGLHGRDTLGDDAATIRRSSNGCI
jgi:hypothetical protein